MVRCKGNPKYGHVGCHQMQHAVRIQLKPSSNVNAGETAYGKAGCKGEYTLRDERTGLVGWAGRTGNDLGPVRFVGKWSFITLILLQLTVTYLSLL